MSTAHLDGQGIAANGGHAHSEHAHGHDDHPAFLQHHFDSPVQQESAAKLGMWLFLATEILMFSGLFLAYFFMRAEYPEMVLEAHERLDKVMGAVNTVVLLFSSLTMALAIRCAQLNQRSKTSMYLIITLLCAGAFMVIKYFEYQAKFAHGLLAGPSFEHVYEAANGVIMAQNASYGGENLFFGIYFTMTGLHGVHVLIGMGLILWIFFKNQKGVFSSAYYTPVENVGLYWHLVDLIWIFLFPLLYLVK